MKTKIIKKILASLLIAATISTVSGAVGAIPPHPKKYAQELYKQVDEDWANSCKTDEAKKVWQQKYSKDNVTKILNDLIECASDPEARKEVADVLGHMINFELLDCLEPNEVVTAIKTLFVCLEDKNAEYPSKSAISDIATKDFMKKLSSEQIFQIIDISQKYNKASWIIELMADEDSFKNFNKQQVLDLLNIAKKEFSDDFRVMKVVDCVVREGSFSKLSPEQIFDVIKVFFKGVYSDDWGNDLESFAQTIELMAEKHLLKGLSSAQISDITKALYVCASHTIDDEVETELRKHGRFSNLSYLNAKSYGFSKGDAARSSVQKAIGFMINDGLFDGSKPDQIIDVLAILKSCLICEIYGAKSNFYIAENIQYMAKRGLFGALEEKGFGLIFYILDTVSNTRFEGTFSSIDHYYVTLALNSILESKPACLTPEIQSQYQSLLAKCKDGYDKHCKF